MYNYYKMYYEYMAILLCKPHFFQNGADSVVLASATYGKKIHHKVFVMSKNACPFLFSKLVYNRTSD